jgi:uroporphyrinogen decarboxylase
MDANINYLKAVHFDHPEWIPMSFHVNSACWDHYPPGALEDLMQSHPLLFPGRPRETGAPVVHGLAARVDEPYTDPWGCIWQTTVDGIVGTVHNHPMADLTKVEGYEPPDPAVTDGFSGIDWGGVHRRFRDTRRNGGLARAGLPHGHTFLRLINLCGYENALLALVDDDPRLRKLLGMIESFNTEVVRRYVDCGAKLMAYPEDLGMQNGPMISPDLFVRHIQPIYRRMIEPARAAGCIIHMHSDGDIRTLAHHLIKGGVEILNLQDLVNGVEWIREKLFGRVCIDLDIDRQKITRYGTPDDIDRLIRTEVETLSTPAGGLTMIHGLYPGVPLENVKALMDAMERYASFHTD